MDLDACFARISDPWRSRIVGEVNGQQIEIARMEGPFL